MYNDIMNEDKVISRRTSRKLSGEVEDPISDNDIDTVALMCIAVVRKAEYDAMKVDRVAPVEVCGEDDQKVVINPFLLVGSSDHTRQEALERINRVWDTYDRRRAEANTDGP